MTMPLREGNRAPSTAHLPRPWPWQRSAAAAGAQWRWRVLVLRPAGPPEEPRLLAGLQHGASRRTSWLADRKAPRPRRWASWHAEAQSLRGQ